MAGLPGTIAQAAFPKLACLRTPNRPRAHRSGRASRDHTPADVDRGLGQPGRGHGPADADGRAAGRTPAWVKANPPSCARPCEHRMILAGPGFDGSGSRPKMLVFTSSAFPPRRAKI